MKKILFLMIFVILSFSVFANYNYSQIGVDDYVQGTGFFNTQMLTDSYVSRNINSPVLMPLVQDLDLDGTNEIIVFDGTSVELYEGSSLNVVDSYTSATTIDGATIYDIDNDNYYEIIISGVDDLEILEYNGTAFYNQTSYLNALTGWEEASTGRAIQCQQAERCLVIYNERNDGVVANSGALEYASFNSSNIIEQGEVYASSNNQEVCLSIIPIIDSGDYDNDGDTELIFSSFDTYGSGTGTLRIDYVYLNSSVNLISEQTSTTGDIVNPVTLECGEVDSFFTSPMTYNIDGFTSNGLETVIGFMISSDDFKMHSYLSTGAFLDDYPEVTNGEGILISNVARANIFTDTNTDDFCVLGYENDADLLNLVCASELTGDIPETVEFDYDKTGLYNVTEGHHLMIHSAQHSSTLTDGADLSEIITSYGVFILDFTGANHLDLIYENSQPDVVLMSVDPQKEDREDLIGLSSTNLWYIDDGFSNSDAVLDTYTINPCVDAVWEVNTSVAITIKPTDADSDLVSARAILYANNLSVPQQDSGWSVNASSGTTFTFNFVANQSVGSDTIDLLVRDTGTGIIDTTTLTFSVASSGVVAGDCLTDVTVGETEAQDTELIAFRANNSITNAMESIKTVSNLNMSNTALWLVLMIFVALGIWNSGITRDAHLLFQALAIAETLMLILGFYLGFIGLGVIFTIVVVSLGAIALKQHKAMTGG